MEKESIKSGAALGLILAILTAAMLLTCKCSGPDRDMDGVTDAQDQCPELFGPAAMAGCPDKDKDSLPDSKDKCPEVAGTIALMGCPDTDKDGVSDQEDACPEQAGEAMGCPDADKDSVSDAQDLCPDKPGPKSTQGCPQATGNLDQKILDKITFAAEHVYFESSKDIIKKESYDDLDTLVSVMKEYKKMSCEIEGHTDNTGKPEKNQDLSQRRANAVMKYLINKGIAKKRLKATGYGSSKPKAENTTEKGKAMNRRVEFKINIE